MDRKRSPNSRRSKRQSKIAEENYWDCSVCTYRNTAEAFKCLMCDVRKGTSTRKPRINPQLVAQQVAQQYPQPLPPPKVSKKERETSRDRDSSSNSTTSSSSQLHGLGGNNAGGLVPTVSGKPEKKKSSSSSSSSTASSDSNKGGRKARPKLKNVDRRNASHEAVTVNNVTVIITEFQPKSRRTSLDQSQNSSSDTNGHQSDSASNRSESRTNGDMHESDSRSSGL